MKIIIFGADGLVGRYCYQYLSKKHLVIPITRKVLEINPNTDLHQTLTNLFKLHQIKGPQVLILNCLGLIPQADKDAKENMYLLINTVFPQILGVFTQQAGVKYIHISTDCVFDGKNGLYNEKDTPNAISIYGLSKSAGEPTKATVIRTSIIGEEFRNKRSLLEWARSNRCQTVNGFQNVYWNGMTGLQLAKCIEKIIDNNWYWEGVRHLYSSEEVSKFELLKIINQVYQLKLTIDPHSVESGKNNCLHSLHDLTEYKIPSLKEQVTEQQEFKLKPLPLEFKMHFLLQPHEEFAHALLYEMNNSGFYVNAGEPNDKTNTILIGSGWKNKEMPKLPYIFVVYNTLQNPVSAKKLLEKEEQVQILSKAQMIFCYEKLDVALLQDHLPDQKNIFYVPFGYSPFYEKAYLPWRNQKEKDIDLLFYGRVSFSNRRHAVVSKLRAAGLKVVWPGAEGSGCHGTVRNQLISRAKIVINICQVEPTNSGNHLARLAFLISNKIFIIRESVGDGTNPLDQQLSQYIVTANDVDDLVNKCKDWLNRSAEERNLVCEQAYQYFKEELPVSKFLPINEMNNMIEQMERTACRSYAKKLLKPIGVPVPKVTKSKKKIKRKKDKPNEHKKGHLAKKKTRR